MCGGKNKKLLIVDRNDKEVKLRPTSPDVPGLLLVTSSPVPSSFKARKNSLLRSGPRRISFSLDGAMSMGGVVLEGCCGSEGGAGRERES